MNAGAAKDVVEHDRPTNFEPAVFNAPDLQAGGNSADLANQSEALVRQGVMPAVEFTGDTSARFIRTQSVDQGTLDAENSGRTRGTEVAAATSDAAPAAPTQSDVQAPPGTSGDRVTPSQPVDQAPPATPGDRATPSQPVDQAPPATPGDRATPSQPVDQAPPATPGDRVTPSQPVDQAPPATPGDRVTPSQPVDQAPPATPGDRVTPVQPVPRPAEAPPSAPTDVQATNPQFLENAKVRRGEGPYQVASRLLAADGQPTKQSDVKALTEAFKKIYGDQQNADPNLPGLAGLKQNHAFINKDNLKAVTEELVKAGHGALAARLTKDATAGAPEAAPGPGDANQPRPSDANPPRPGEQQPRRQFSGEEIAGMALDKIAEAPRNQPIDRYIESLGKVITDTLRNNDTFKPGTTRDTITEELNKKAASSEDPRIKGKEFYWDSNKLKLRDKIRPASTNPPARTDGQVWT